MNSYEQLWTVMNSNEQLLTVDNSYEQLRTVMNSYELLWTFMNSYEQLTNPYLRNVFGIFQAYLRHMSSISQADSKVFVNFREGEIRPKLFHFRGFFYFRWNCMTIIYFR